MRIFGWSAEQRASLIFCGLTGLSVLFILNSHPFMFPGYDVWWHMGAIDTAHLSDAQGSRYWHKLWNVALSWVPEAGFFDRALIVHRVQFLLSVALVGLSGYWVLRATFHRSSVHHGEQLVLAWVGVLVWLFMQGTQSETVYGGRESATVMAWMSWYSINYQIALPICLTAGAALLYAVAMPLSTWHRVVMLVISAGGLLLTALIHAAEVPYFLAAAAVVGVLYVRGRREMLGTMLLLVVVAGGVYIGLRHSYRAPELLHLAIQGEWSTLANLIAQSGHYLVTEGANRSTTGWNTLYTLSALLLVASLPLAWRLRPSVALRPMLFVLLTGLMPLMLLFQWSAGLLATITYASLAWRFAFASFLFLAVPIFLALLGQLLPSRFKPWSQVAAAVLFAVLVYSHSRWVDRLQVVNTFALSIVQSISPRNVHFGLSSEEQSALDAMHARLIHSPPGKPLCVDVFSAHYLFFVKDFRAVYVPGKVNRLPTVQHKQHDCVFPRNGGDLVALGIQQPPWRFRLEQRPAD